MLKEITKLYKKSYFKQTKNSCVKRLREKEDKMIRNPLQKKVEKFGEIFGSKMQSTMKLQNGSMMYKKSLPERRKQNDIMIDAVKLIQQLDKVPK